MDQLKEGKQHNHVHVQKNPVKITFENLEFEVNILLSKKEAKEKGQNTIRQKIVKGATGYALPGQTLYIMGSSGAGKTSLLNILSDRISSRNGQKVTGRLMINDELPLDQQVFGNVGAYVMQDDILYSSFTPKEALTFAARLKLGGEIADQDKRVVELLEELGLTSIQDVMIGSVLQKTISGGERKRTAIGVELITDPSLLLLDEPTSGLDSFKALQIVKLLEKQAHKGKTVISTIHQPSSEAFQIFDRLILMMDGYIVYQGRAKDSTTYFNQIGYQCPVHSNPTDYFMKIMTVNYPKGPADEKYVQSFFSSYSSILANTVSSSHREVQLAIPDLVKESQNNASWCTQFSLILWRNRQGVKRHPAHGRIKIAQNIFLGLICLALFHDQYNYSQARSLISSLFFIAINQTMMNLMGTLLTFQEERPVFLREQANKMYSVSSYYMAKIVIETPILSFTPLLFAIIIYFKIGLTITATQFFYFYLIILLVAQCSASFGYFISSIFEREEMAVSLAPVIMMPIMLFGGQFANAGNIQAWISWLQYVSPIRYAFECFVRNEFDHRTYDTDMILRNISSGHNYIILDAISNQTAFRNINMTQFTIVQNPEVNPVGPAGFDIGLWKCLVILACLTIGLRILSLIFLRLLVSKFQ